MDNIIEIAKVIEKNGGRLYLVGGAVRDQLLNNKVHDRDYCVTGIEKELFKKLFPNALERGRAFSVFEINKNEFALARKEEKTGVGHKEFNIKTNKDITIIEDLVRRDITINSIAIDVLTNEIIDPFNGINDLNNKIIRATSEKFREDPLRVYRVARFAAMLEFEVDNNTIKQMNELKSELNNLSKERVFVEFEKSLKTNKPSIFFNVLRKTDVLDIHFDFISNLIDVEQPIVYHPEGDAYNHTMLALDIAANMTDNVEYRFAVLVHDLGKALTPKSMYPHHYDHEKKGVSLVEKINDKISLPISWIKSGKISALEHMHGGIFYKMRPVKQVKFIEKISNSRLGLEGMQIVVYADALSSSYYNKEDEVKQKFNFIDIGKSCLKTINGEYIIKKYGKVDGKKFGQLLDQERIEWIKNNVK